jgi:hypothetical protein
MQTNPEGQIFPHKPQFSSSCAKSVQTPLQQPGVCTDDKEEHVLPQLPQFSTSVSTFALQVGY